MISTHGVTVVGFVKVNIAFTATVINTVVVSVARNGIFNVIISIQYVPTIIIKQANVFAENIYQQDTEISNLRV